MIAGLSVTLTWGDVVVVAAVAIVTYAVLGRLG